MCPAQDNHANQTWMDWSHCLSNIAPQHKDLNAGLWNILEKYVRFLAGLSENMYIVTGAAYIPSKVIGYQYGRDNFEVNYRVIGEKHVSVPTHFFKVWYTENPDGKNYMEAFVLPNAGNLGKKINDYRIDINKGLPKFEIITGLEFFREVDRNKVIKPRDILRKFYGLRDNRIQLNP